MDHWSQQFYICSDRCALTRRGLKQDGWLEMLSAGSQWLIVLSSFQELVYKHSDKYKWSQFYKSNHISKLFSHQKLEFSLRQHCFKSCFQLNGLQPHFNSLNSNLINSHSDSFGPFIYIFWQNLCFQWPFISTGHPCGSSLLSRGVILFLFYQPRPACLA